MATTETAATTEFTIDDLRRILREGAGEELDLDGDILDLTFEELGYESLALLETGVRIGREYGVELEDSTLTDVETPRQLVEAVNSLLVATRAA
ncbi:acyl carrier protein [Streptomyces sp. NPDC007369]|uniref:acyl carrier protein n=1 Tax=Streptomyces sp. NPDC007369 TaxID=3154589 RepID=UPI0033DDFB9D